MFPSNKKQNVLTSSHHCSLFPNHPPNHPNHSTAINTKIIHSKQFIYQIFCISIFDRMWGIRVNAILSRPTLLTNVGYTVQQNLSHV